MYRVVGVSLVLWMLPFLGMAGLIWWNMLSAERADRQIIEEWLQETRIFRKTLPDLVREYIIRSESGEAFGDKRDEIHAQLDALADPLMTYSGQLPMFPEVHSFRISFGSSGISAIDWQSPQYPATGWEKEETGLRRFSWELVSTPVISSKTGKPAEVRARMSGLMKLHVYAQAEKQIRQQARLFWAATGIVLVGGLIAVWSGSRILQRERRRELRRIDALQQADRLGLELLEQRLEASRLEVRANEAEKARLEIQSQIYASIGIMAGSYAHNIKNLLVRPNDLLARCIEADGIAGEQNRMLLEVRSTLGTVTDRLQMILKTVRSDPNQTRVETLDLNKLVAETERNWTLLAADKWKLNLTIEMAPGTLEIVADESLLHQTIENLVFNARDATFMMRRQLGEQWKLLADPVERKRARLSASEWKGEVLLRTRQDERSLVLEVRDNGIGMTDEVRDRCTETHFSTKRGQAEAEGMAAGMGLGLSFVARVLEQHDATMEIESEPMRGALFRLRFPKPKVG